MAEQHFAFQFKGSLFTLTILQLINPDEKALTEQLEHAIKQAPKFFESAPIVIDLHRVADTGYKIDFAAFCSLLRNYRLIPIGICGGSPEQQQAALAAGIAVLPVSKNYQDPAPAPTKPTTKTQPNTGVPTKLITQPVRSGQQIYAKGTDLVVLAPVSHGAELLADGNIHVYGSLRGRALAGINGDKTRRIFCQHLDAELVSIAGIYRLSDDFSINKDRKNVQIYLDDEHLQIGEI